MSKSNKAKNLKTGRNLLSYISLGLSGIATIFSLLSQIPLAYFPQIFLALNCLTYLTSLGFFLGQNLFNEELYHGKINNQTIPPRLVQRKYKYLLQNLVTVFIGAIAASFMILILINPVFAIPASFLSSLTQLSAFTSARRLEAYYKEKIQTEGLNPLKKMQYEVRYKEKVYARQATQFLLLNSLNLAIGCVLLFVAPPLAISIYVYLGVSSAVIGLFLAKSYLCNFYQKYQYMRMSYLWKDVQNESTLEHNEGSVPSIIKQLNAEVEKPDVSPDEPIAEDDSPEESVAVMDQKIAENQPDEYRQISCTSSLFLDLKNRDYTPDQYITVDMESSFR